jgi:hypothetical protein
MNDGNLGLAAGLLMLACGIAITLGYQAVGGILWIIGLGFAVALGLSKRAKNKSAAKGKQQ